MPLRTRLIVFGYPALEIATAWWVATIIGWGNVIGLLIVGAVVGFLLMRAAGRAAFASWQVAATTGTLPEGAAGSHVLRFLAGLLIAIPGFWTDLLGIALALPPVQAIVRPRFASWFGVRATMRSTTQYGDVIQGVVIHDEEPPNPRGTLEP